MINLSSKPGTKMLMYFLLQFLLCMTGARAAAAGGPFALTLGPTTITASRVNISGSVETTNFPVTPEYHGYFEDAVLYYGRRIEVRVNEWYVEEDGTLVPAAPDTHDESAAESVSRTAITAVTQNMSDALGYRPTYSALFLPAIFNFSSAHAASDAIFPAKDGRPVKVGRGWQGPCRAYNLYRCELLGRPSEDCHDDGPMNSFLVLEYEESYLYVWLVDLMFEWEGFIRKSESFCRDCGYRFQEVRFERIIR
jgi:hypothetical protein